MASKSAHRLFATYNSSIDFRFCPLHSAIIFSRSSIDFSSAAIRASLYEKGKKRGFQNFFAGLSRGYSSSWANTAFVQLPQRLLTFFFPHTTTSYMFSRVFRQLHVFKRPTTVLFRQL